MSAYTLSELDRRLANIIRFGKVSEIDVDAFKVKVDIGTDEAAQVTEWLPWLTRRAGDDTTWDPPDVGEQVIIFSPGGELDQGIVGPSLFSDDKPPNGTDAKDRRVTFKDGSIIEFDRDSSALNLKLASAAVLTISIGGTAFATIKDGELNFGNTPTSKATKADVIMQNVNNLAAYLQALAAVFATMPPEAGMGAPSSFAIALNAVHSANSTKLTMTDAAASEVFVK